MRIVEYYSHLNGYEHIKIHKRGMWKEIERVVSTVDAAACRTKLSKEKTKVGKTLYSPIDLNRRFSELLQAKGWHESRTSYWVTSDYKLIRKTMHLTPDEQRQEIIDAGKTPIFSYNQTDFVKDRIAIEVQFGKYAFVAYDLFVKHLAFFVGDVIDLGVEILPMKELQQKMSSGVGYYESELYNLVREGRGVPAVPLILLGV